MTSRAVYARNTPAQITEEEQECMRATIERMKDTTVSLKHAFKGLLEELLKKGVVDERKFLRVGTDASSAKIANRRERFNTILGRASVNLKLMRTIPLDGNHDVCLTRI